MSHRLPTEFRAHPSPFLGGRYRAFCSHVVDGDTLDVLIDVGFNLYEYEVVRLAGIDTPELNSRDEAERVRAREARDFVVAAALNKPVIVETVKDRDKYGRYLAAVLVTTSGTVWTALNDMLVEVGMATRIPTT